MNQTLQEKFGINDRAALLDKLFDLGIAWGVPDDSTPRVSVPAMIDYDITPAQMTAFFDNPLWIPVQRMML